MPQQPRILIGIDPGLATGVCVVDISDPLNPMPLESFELSVEEFFEKITELFRTYEDITLVCEDFHITVETAKLSPQPYSLWLIGVCQYAAYYRGIKVYLQSPSRKPFADNDKLRKVGFWHVGGGGHANDSYRHAMIWIVDRYPKWTKKLLV